MSVLIDITRLLDRALQERRPTGVDRVGLAYVEHFQERALALVRYGGRWMVFPEADSRRLLDWMIAPAAESAPHIRRLVGKNYLLNWRPPAAGGILINVTHSGLDEPDYASRIHRYRLRPLYFLHDLIPIVFPEYGRPGVEERHRRRLVTMLTTACGLVVNSAVTGEELASYASNVGMPLPPWVVAHLAPPAFPLPAAERPLRAPYFVVLGTLEPRKNHLLLLNVWRSLIATYGEAVPHLVVIGQRGWECEQVMDMLERCAVLKGRVVELSECDDAALATWLGHAQALLFPSFAEGYGIPLVEALVLGTPVIASELPVFHELAGDIPEYLDPLDGLGWRQAVLDYVAADSPRRSAQLARMAGWKAPSWEAHFALVDAFLDRHFH